MAILEILKYTLPAVVVLITAYLIIKSFINNEDKRRQHEEKKRKLDIQKSSKNTLTPIKLQAFERVILFLERISPETMIMRVQKPGMNVVLLQTELLKIIRAEFEHNISQQLYVSNETWQVIKNAKESTIRLINEAAGRCKPEDEAMVLSTNIMGKLVAIKASPSAIAVELIKNEMQEYFG